MNRIVFLLLLLPFLSIAQPAPFLRNAWTTNAAGTPVQGLDNLSITNLGSGTNWQFFNVGPKTVARLSDVTNVVAAIGGGDSVWTNDSGTIKGIPPYTNVLMTNPIVSGLLLMTNSTTNGSFFGDYAGALAYFGAVSGDGVKELSFLDSSLREESEMWTYQTVAPSTLEDDLAQLYIRTKINTNTHLSHAEFNLDVHSAVTPSSSCFIDTTVVSNPTSGNGHGGVFQMQAQRDRTNFTRFHEIEFNNKPENALPSIEINYQVVSNKPVFQYSAALNGGFAPYARAILNERAGWTLTSLLVTNVPALLIGQEWSNAAVKFEGVSISITNKSSSNTSRFFSLKTNGTEIFGIGQTNLWTFNGVAYGLPSSQGAAQSVLTNDGNGALGWDVLAGGSGEANVNGEISVTNATRFGWVYGKAGITNLLRSFQPGNGLVGTNEGTNISLAIDPAIVASQANLTAASNAVMTFVGETNFNGEVSVTNATRIGWVHDKVGITNRLRSVMGGNGITLTNEGTNVMVALTTDPTAYQPASTILTNLSGTGAITNLFSPTLSNAAIKPLVVGIGDAAGATNVTGHIRGLEAGANITLSANGSNIVVASTASGGGLTTNANQFGESVELTIKSGALVTNLSSLNLTNRGDMTNAGLLTVGGTVRLETNLFGLGTNDLRYLKLSGGVDRRVILRTDDNTNVVATTIGTGLAFDGTTLSATASGGGLSTNANQFAASVELAIKSGALLTNTLFYPSNLTGPAEITLASVGQVTNLSEWRQTNGAVSLAVSSNGLFNISVPLLHSNAIAFRTNNIDFSLGQWQTFSNAVRTNLVLQLTNCNNGVTHTLDAFGAGRLGNGLTNAWQLLCTVESGNTIYWPPGTTNGNFDLLLNSNQVVTLTFRQVFYTNIFASYLVREGIGAN